MARTAGCLACLALLLAMPGLRALCAEACPPEIRTAEPPCHDEQSGQRQPPGDPPGSCAHGDAVSSTAARPAPDGAAAAWTVTTPHLILHGHSALELQRVAASGPPHPAPAAGLRLPPLRC